MNKVMASMMCKAGAVKQKITEKMSGDSQVVVALILIVVALGLCIIFRNQVNTILQNIATRVSDTVNSLAAGTVQ